MNEISVTAGDNEALLQKLTLRLLISRWDPREQDPHLLVGQIPEGLPFSLPLPQESQVLGSLLRSPEQIEIVLDSSLPPTTVIDFYKQQMQNAGWYEPESIRDHYERGFTHSGFPRPGTDALFCQGTHSPSLEVTALQGKNAPTDVRLQLNMSRHNSPCAQQSRRFRHGSMAQDLIPRLDPPPGARQMGGGGGGSNDTAYTSATLETDAAMPILNLANHYATQLETAGWTRLDEGHSGPLAWHAWTLHDEENEPWQGLFFAIKTPGTENDYTLHLKIDSDTGKEMKRGWIVSG